VVVHSFEGYHWIYWAGPILGAVVASGLYKFIKMLENGCADPDLKELKAMQQAETGNSDRPHDSSLVELFPYPPNYGAENGAGTPNAMQGSPMTPRPSTKERRMSPAMGTTDEAFRALDGGTHAKEYGIGDDNHREERANDSMV
jgi:aquaporin related protein